MKQQLEWNGIGRGGAGGAGGDGGCDAMQTEARTSHVRASAGLESGFSIS